MKIYDLKNREYKKYFRKFEKTAYGKIVFCLAYAIPLVMLIVSVETAVYRRLDALLISLFVLLVFFILGTRYFYKEFKEFLEDIDE